MMSQAHVSDELLGLTRIMLSAAEAGDWGMVEKIEIQRQAVLKKLESIISGAEAKDGIADHLREVLLINTRMMELGQHAKAGLVKAMGGISQGRQAVKAYYGDGIR